MDDFTNSVLDFKDKQGFSRTKIGDGMANPDPNRKVMQHEDK